MRTCMCTYVWGTEGVLKNTEESAHETVEVGLSQLWQKASWGPREELIGSTV